ncbi:collagenase-like [Sabethes cyaneus]|uniref:collagenase-like n=1 Tax=Sabethes cyaneus TaxID=53552 RepID=UPI00237EC9B4|nr:collagenase-like [Sabethes cyaneus]
MKFLLVLPFLAALASVNIAFERNQRIIGSELATSGQFPYAVGIITQINPLFNGRCSGSLLSTSYILTSAACLMGIVSAVAVLGALRINDPTEPETLRVTVRQFIRHSGYELDGENFDIALIVLPSAITFTDKIQPIRLPNRQKTEDALVGQQGTFVGWGEFGEGNVLSPDLRFGRAPVITNMACTVSLPTRTILDEHICTSGFNDTDSQSSPCRGDSGAPLTVLGEDGIPTQIGLFTFHSSFGCITRLPAVFTRLSSYLDWIEENSDVEVGAGF